MTFSLSVKWKLPKKSLYIEDPNLLYEAVPHLWLCFLWDWCEVSAWPFHRAERNQRWMVGLKAGESGLLEEFYFKFTQVERPFILIWDDMAEVSLIECVISCTVPVVILYEPLPYALFQWSCTESFGWSTACWWCSFFLFHCHSSYPHSHQRDNLWEFAIIFLCIQYKTHIQKTKNNEKFLNTAASGRDWYRRKYIEEDRQILNVQGFYQQYS